MFPYFHRNILQTNTIKFWQRMIFSSPVVGFVYVVIQSNVV
uniref:Uncharacterized protein n=1 Tax=Anopheles atroparvus TaxID=41427 RepID=A0AAG5DAT1_ANOAO